MQAQRPQRALNVLPPVKARNVRDRDRVPANPQAGGNEIVGAQRDRLGQGRQLGGLRLGGVGIVAVGRLRPGLGCRCGRRGEVLGEPQHLGDFQPGGLDAGGVQGPDEGGDRHGR